MSGDRSGWYTNRITQPRCMVCHAPATVRVFNNRNGEIGPHCTRCGDRVIRDANARAKKEQGVKP